MNAIKSATKTSAARENGKKGGRSPALISEAKTRRAMYAAISRFQTKRKTEGNATFFTPISRAAMDNVASLAPKTAKWSWSVPGVSEGDASDYAEALAAADGESSRVSVSAAFVFCDIDGRCLLRLSV